MEQGRGGVGDMVINWGFRMLMALSRGVQFHSPIRDSLTPKRI